MKLVLCVSVLGLFASVTAWAQATAQIHGTVQDSSGASIPDAEIKATQTETGVSRTIRSGADGGYLLTNLPIGPYQVEVTKDGFTKNVQSGVVLQVNSDPVIDPVLKVGSVSEQVLVEANVTQVETRSSGIGEVVQTQRIVDLPLNGRNVTDLITLAGAAVNQGNIRNSFFQNLPMINIAGQPTGGQPFGTDYSLDGANHRNYLTATTMPVAFPEAVQEFKVESSGQSSQRGSSASVSMVTRSGSNEFHGNLFEFIRNDGFGSAREYFSTTRSSLKRHQFGGTAGGPIKQNKLFFFGGFQATTLIQTPGNTLAAIPTPAMMAGDWSAHASAACNGGAPRTLRGPFVNNQINPAQFSKTAAYIVNKFLPTIGATPDQCGNFFYGTPNNETDRQYVGKGDYQISSNQSLFIRALLSEVKLPNPMESSPSLLLVGNNGQNQLAQSYAIGHTYIISPTMVQSFRVAYHRTATGNFGNNYAFDFCEAGMQNFWCESPKELGVATITGGFPVGGTSQGKNFWYMNAGSIDEDVSWIKGGHQVTFGGGVLRGMAYQLNHFASVGTFVFNGQQAGSGLADFMAGLPATVFQGLPNTVVTRQNMVNLYLTDSWKLSPRLTFNFGIRWEPFLPMTVSNGQVSVFDMNRYRDGVRSTVFVNAPLGFYFPGDPGFPGKQAVNRQMTNFAPRGGVAWDPKGDGKMSIRAAYAFGYAFIPGVSRQDQAGSNPWGGRSTFTLAGPFDNPYANVAGGNPYPFVIDKNVKFPAQGQFITNDYDLPTARTYSWNIAIQRQIGATWIASATYIGSRVTRLYVNVPINSAQIVPGPIVTTGCAATATNCNAVANIQARRVLSLINPTQGLLVGNLDKWDPSGASKYNGLLLSLQKRISRGVSMSSNWTWSHCTSVFQGYDSKSDQTATVAGNPLFDRGNCDSDRRHLVNITAVAQTPRFTNTMLRRTLTDWQVAGIYSFRSGAPIAVQNGTDRQLSGINHQRPNLVLPDQVYTGNTGPSGQYLNPAAFAQQPLGAVGNLGWNNLVGQTYWTANLALSRQFRLTERQRLEVRADAFHFTNSFVAAPATTASPTSAAVPAFANLNNAQFGQTLAAQPTRKLQFALRYSF